MTDTKTEAKTVDVELLAGAIRLDGVTYRRGATITLPEDHAKRLAEFDSVAPVGTLAKRAKAQERAAAILAAADEVDTPVDAEPEPVRRAGVGVK